MAISSRITLETNVNEYTENGRGWLVVLWIIGLASSEHYFSNIHDGNKFSNKISWKIMAEN
jgi:hypothetical protein